MLRPYKHASGMICSKVYRSMLVMFFCPAQAAVYGSRDATLTPEIFQRVLQMKLREHEQRKSFEAEQGQ